MLNVRFKNGRTLGRVEENFAATLSNRDTFFFAGLSLEVIGIDGEDLMVRATTREARIPTYGGARLALSTNLADRVRGYLADPSQWTRFPDDVREWLEVQKYRSVLPEPGQLLVETFPREGRHYMVAYSFEGWNAHQSLGMLITKRMETLGLKPLGFVANDYAIATYSLDPVTDPAALFSADILEHEFVDWVERSHLLKRAFREVAVIGGLVERQHPGKRKTGKQVTFSTDLIYDVLRKYEPTHLLLEAAWADARARMTDVGRLAEPARPGRRDDAACRRRSCDAAGGAGADPDRARADRDRRVRRCLADRSGIAGGGGDGARLILLGTFCRNPVAISLGSGSAGAYPSDRSGG